MEERVLAFENIFRVTQVFYIYMIIKGFDQITGVLQALYNKQFKSREMRDGLFRVVFELIAIAFLKVIDYAFIIDIQLSVYLCGFFILKDIFSIIENLGRTGVTLPEAITSRMVSLREFFMGKEKEGE